MALLTLLRTFPHKRAVLFSLCLVLLFAVLPLAAEDTSKKTDQFSEYEIKAAYLINFIKYVEWPDRAFKNEDSPFKIGICGRNPFGNVLHDLAEAADFGGRKMLIERGDDIAALTGCHLVFFDDNGEKSRSSELAQLKKRSILSVGEQKGFTKQGGIINFVIVDTKVRFEINLKTAKHNNLKISSRLLKVSHKVFK